VNPVLERRLVLDQVEAKAGELAFFPDPRVREPDRRHQLPVREDGEDLRVDLVGLAGEWSEALHLLRVGDLDVPALGLERVVDEPGAGHRLDHRADRLAVGLLDSAGEAPQCVGVRRRGQLIEVLSGLGEQTDVELLSAEIQSGVQH
jgi:hypothetical protein